MANNEENFLPSYHENHRDFGITPSNLIKPKSKLKFYYSILNDVEIWEIKIKKKEAFYVTFDPLRVALYQSDGQVAGAIYLQSGNRQSYRPKLMKLFTQGSYNNHYGLTALSVNEWELSVKSKETESFRFHFEGPNCYITSSTKIGAKVATFSKTQAETKIGTLNFNQEMDHNTIVALILAFSLSKRSRRLPTGQYIQKISKCYHPSGFSYTLGLNLSLRLKESSSHQLPPYQPNDNLNLNYSLPAFSLIT